MTCADRGNGPKGGLTSCTPTGGLPEGLTRGAVGGLDQMATALVLLARPVSFLGLHSFMMVLPGAWSTARTASCTAPMTAIAPFVSASP
eukprot:16076588-Heterocapsa_arctica.AAC.1